MYDQPASRLLSNSLQMDDPRRPSSSILGGVARRTLGICLLLIVVVLWTASNFLASVSVPDTQCAGASI